MREGCFYHHVTCVVFLTRRLWQGSELVEEHKSLIYLAFDQVTCAVGYVI